MGLFIGLDEDLLMYHDAVGRSVYAGEDKRRSAHALVCLLGRQVMVKIAAHAINAPERMREAFI